MTKGVKTGMSVESMFKPNEIQSNTDATQGSVHWVSIGCILVTTVAAIICYIILLVYMIFTLPYKSPKVNDVCGLALNNLAIADIILCILTLFFGYMNVSTVPDPREPPDTQPAKNTLCTWVLTIIIFTASIAMAILDIMESSLALENPECRRVMNPTGAPVLAILTICFGVTHIIRAAGVVAYWFS
jgi:hypothetical protein